MNGVSRRVRFSSVRIKVRLIFYKRRPSSELGFQAIRSNFQFVRMFFMSFDPILIRRNRFGWISVLTYRFVVSINCKHFNRMFRVFHLPSMNCTIFRAPTMTMIFLSMIRVGYLTACLNRPCRRQDVNLNASFAMFRRLVANAPRARRYRVFIRRRRANKFSFNARRGLEGAFPVFVFSNALRRRFLTRVIVRVPHIFGPRSRTNRSRWERNRISPYLLPIQHRIMRRNATGQYNG